VGCTGRAGPNLIEELVLSDGFHVCL
jgi:hypothetical protein